MSESKEKPQSINGLVNANTSRDQFVGVLQSLLNPEETEKLGGVEVAADKVPESLAYLGVFAPAPATFDKDAFAFTAGANLLEEEGSTVWETLKRVGVLKDESATSSPGRYSISKELVDMLTNPNNKFLTED